MVNAVTILCYSISKEKVLVQIPAANIVQKAVVLQDKAVHYAHIVS